MSELARVLAGWRRRINVSPCRQVGSSSPRYCRRRRHRSGIPRCSVFVTPSPAINDGFHRAMTSTARPARPLHISRQPRHARRERQGRGRCRGRRGPASGQGAQARKRLDLLLRSRPAVLRLFVVIAATTREADLRADIADLTAMRRSGAPSRGLRAQVLCDEYCAHWTLHGGESCSAFGKRL